MLFLSIILLSSIFITTEVISKSTQSYEDGKFRMENVSDSDIAMETNGTSISISNFLKDICIQGAHKTIPDPVCASQVAFMCEKSEILLKMLDATSKYSGVLYGSRMDFGNFDECINIDYDYAGGRLLGKYCPLAMLLPDPVKGFSDWAKIYKLSVCLPSGCSLRLFSNIADRLGFENELDEIDDLCVTKETGRSLSVEATIIITCLAFWVGIILIFTSYDVYLQVTNRGSNAKVNMLSFFANAKKLLNTKSNPNNVEVFDGLKVISMAWIIIGHGYGTWNQIVPSVNVEEPYEQGVHEYHYTFLLGAHLACDTFFFISGFLVAYNYFKKNEKSVSSQLKSVPAFYLHRYLRLTISLGLLFAFGVWIFPHIGKGPLWNVSTLRSSKRCKKYWWSFFLYIQNYYNYDDICFIPSWYLNADMQMFILSPLLLIPLSVIMKRSMKLRLPMVGLGIFNLIIAVVPHIINYQIKYENEFDTHSRLINYFLGITAGFAFQKTKSTEYLPFVALKKVKKVNLIVWFIVLLQMLMVVLLYQPVEVSSNRLAKPLFYGFTRPIWCIGLIWIVYSCQNGYGGIVNWILTRPVMKILSKMTYSMFIIHLFTIGNFFLRNQVRLYYSDYVQLYLFCGYYAETVIYSVLWSLIFEFPILSIERELLRRT